MSNKVCAGKLSSRVVEIMNTQSKEIAQSGFGWATAFIDILSDLDTVLNREGLPNTTQSSILAFLLLQKEPIRVGFLSDALSLKPNTTTASINTLEDRSLISRNQVGNDRRGINLSLTEEGEAAVGSIVDIVDSYLNKNFEITDSFRTIYEDDARYSVSTKLEFYSLLLVDVRKFILNLGYFARSNSINLSSLRLLAHISFSSKPKRMVDYCDLLVMHQNVLSISASFLEKNGYITKETDKSDHRASLLRITRKGRRLSNKSVEYINDLVEKSPVPFLKTLPNYK